jgi:hypothetical protein
VRQRAAFSEGQVPTSNLCPLPCPPPPHTPLQALHEGWPPGEAPPPLSGHALMLALNDRIKASRRLVPASARPIPPCAQPPRTSAAPLLLSGSGMRPTGCKRDQNGVLTVWDGLVRPPLLVYENAKRRLRPLPFKTGLHVAGGAGAAAAAPLSLSTAPPLVQPHPYTTTPSYRAASRYRSWGSCCSSTGASWTSTTPPPRSRWPFGWKVGAIHTYL